MSIIMATMSGDLGKAYTACRLYIEALEKVAVISEV
jgi:hypothetical protein